MKTEKDLGAVLVGLLADEVSMQEVRLVLTQLRDKEALRQRASSIGMLAGGSNEERAKMCRNMIDILMAWIPPRTLTEQEDRVTYPTCAEEFRCGRWSLVEPVLLPLPKISPWFNHVFRHAAAIWVDDKNRCHLSQELFDLIQALEDLWGMQGDYLDRTPAIEYVPLNRRFMELEKRKRGAKAVCK